jgi:WD40 repeat protein
MRKILATLVTGAVLVASCSPSTVDESGGGGGAGNVPDHLGVQTQPTLVDVGAAMTPALRVRVLDAGGGLVDSSDIDAITVEMTPNVGSVLGAVVTGTTTRPVVDGVATFNDLTFTTEGTGFSLTFTAAGVTEAVSNTFNVTNNANFIYFSSNRTGSFEVWRMKDDGTQQAQATTRAMASDPTPAKNPTNGLVAFSDGPTSIQALYTMIGGDGTQVRQVQTRSDAGETSWSPDGVTIASRVAAGAPSFGLFTIRGDGTDRTQLGGGIEDFPTWSPEADKIAYSQNYLDLMVKPKTGGAGSAIVRHDTTDAGVGILRTAAGDSVFGFNSTAGFVPFTYLNTLILHTAWSPDGMRIAFELEDVNGVAHIFVISNLGGGVLVPLTNHATFSDRSPTWSPDGTKIFFESNRSGTWQIWWMYANGSGLAMLTNTGNNYSPSWWN